MEDKKDILGVTVRMDSAVTELAQALDALLVLDEIMELNGFQAEGNFNEMAAINFSLHFPIYLNTFRVICNELSRITGKLQENVNSIYAAARAQKALCRDSASGDAAR